MPDALVTLLRVTNRSRPQRKKSAASKTGSNSVRMYEIGSPFFGDAKLCIEQLVRQLRPGRGGPARAASEVVLQDRTIGVRLEVATRPSHRRFDDLVADHKHAVARTGIAEPARRPFRRTEAFLVLDGFRPLYADAQRL